MNLSTKFSQPARVEGELRVARDLGRPHGPGGQGAPRSDRQAIDEAVTNATKMTVAEAAQVAAAANQVRVLIGTIAPGSGIPAGGGVRSSALITTIDALGASSGTTDQPAQERRDAGRPARRRPRLRRLHDPRGHDHVRERPPHASAAQFLCPRRQLRFASRSAADPRSRDTRWHVTPMLTSPVPRSEEARMNSTPQLVPAPMPPTMAGRGRPGPRPDSLLAREGCGVPRRAARLCADQRADRRRSCTRSTGMRNARACNRPITELASGSRVPPSTFSALRANLRAHAGQIATSLDLQRAVIAGDQGALRRIALADRARVVIGGHAFGSLAPPPRVASTALIASNGRVLARVTVTLALGDELLKLIRDETPLPAEAAPCSPRTAG